jgi:hypothetical protein
MNVIGMKQFIGVLPLAAALSSVGCGASESADEGLQFGSVGAALIGDALPGSDPEEVEEAAAAFASIEGITDGVGPIFNERACGSCHTGGAMGGSGEQIERRFGRVQGGIFNSQANLGGSLRQLFTVGNFNNPNLPPASRGSCQAGNPTLCCVPQEVEPATATVHNVGRRTTPLFGRHARFLVHDAAQRATPCCSRHHQPSAIAAAGSARPHAKHRLNARRALWLESRDWKLGSVLRGRLPQRNGHHYAELYQRRFRHRFCH